LFSLWQLLAHHRTLLSGSSFMLIVHRFNWFCTFFQQINWLIMDFFYGDFEWILILPLTLYLTLKLLTLLKLGKKSSIYSVSSHTAVTPGLHVLSAEYWNMRTIDICLLTAAKRLLIRNNDALWLAVTVNVSCARVLCWLYNHTVRSTQHMFPVSTTCYLCRPVSHALQVACVLTTVTPLMAFFTKLFKSVNTKQITEYRQDFSLKASSKPQHSSNNVRSRNYRL